MKSLKHVTHGTVFLGCERKPHLFKSIPFSNYAKGSAIPFPPTCAWERPIDFGMLGNDVVGNCVIVYMLHQIMAWAAVAHAIAPKTFTTEQSIQVYSDITGYVPGDESTDQGADPNQALQYWQSSGLFGDKIAGFTSLDTTNLDMLKSAIYFFGGIGFSLDVPQYVMSVPAGGSWSASPGADMTIVGSHQVGLLGYGSKGFRLDSWGTTYTIDYDTFAQLVIANQAAVSPDWIKQSGVSPGPGLDLAGLLADLAA